MKPKEAKPKVYCRYHKTDGDCDCIKKVVTDEQLAIRIANREGLKRWNINV